MHRVALAIARQGEAETSRPRDPTGESFPRSHVFDDAFFPVWDETLLNGTGNPRFPPLWWRMANAIHSRDDEFDALVTWGEKLSLAVMLEQRFARRGKPHVAMMYQFEKLNIRLPLEISKSRLHAVVTWSSVQRDALVDRIGYPRDRVFLVRHYVDQLFYRPREEVEPDMICAVGAEMRDYATLLNALRDTGLRCHIATDHVRVPGRFRLLNDRRVAIEELGASTPEVTTGRMSLLDLRKLYARSRFVVIPLLPSDTDNGVTCILQAMAMGKPVICSRTRGQVDVIEDGETGLFVPVGDPVALRRAMLALWNDPQRAREMGARARAHVEKHHTLETFTATTRSAVEASLQGRPAPAGWWTGD